MGKETDEIGILLKHAFPHLADDPNFKLTSKPTSKYNCIAWAYNIDDKWMWPNDGSYLFLDGVHYWPTDESCAATIDNFVDAFRLKGYEKCSGSEHEPGYLKVALYAQPGSNICTHAARELTNGFWTSKLGKGPDIQHGTPFSLESKCYGKVCIFLKRIFR